DFTFLVHYEIASNTRRTDHMANRAVGVVGRQASRGASVAYFSGVSVRMKGTSCQRCGSGSLLKDGIPRSGLPLVIFQNNVPSLWFCTSGSWKSAACFFIRPDPSWP